MDELECARNAHETLVAALTKLESAHKNATLAFAEIMHGEHYRVLGYADIQHYALEGLKLSHGKTMQFVRLAKDIKRLPALEKALETGEVTWTKARTVGAVATPDNQDEWVELAKNVPRRELEKKAKQVRRRRKGARTTQRDLALGISSALPIGDPPRRISFELTALQSAQFEKLMERARRQGQKDTAQLLLCALDLFTSQHVTRVNGDSISSEGSAAELNGTPAEPGIRSRPAAQVVLYRCDACTGVASPTRDGMKTLSAAEARAALCDAVEIREDGSTKSTIRPRVRHRVLMRDQHRCRRCANTQFVDVHHLHRQVDKGEGTVDNCVSLCRRCHVNWHAEEERLLAAGVTFERILERAREFARFRKTDLTFPPPTNDDGMPSSKKPEAG